MTTCRQILIGWQVRVEIKHDNASFRLFTSLRTRRGPGGYTQVMPAKYTILIFLTIVFVMSLACPACSYTATSAHGLSTHQNQWCKRLRNVSNKVMDARRERQAPQPPPMSQAESGASLHDNDPIQGMFEAPEPFIDVGISLRPSWSEQY